MVAAGCSWAAPGLANLVIALYFDIATRAWFVVVGAIGAKVAVVALRYAIFQTIVCRRLAQSIN